MTAPGESLSAARLPDPHNLRGATLTITVEEGGYVKAYASPPVGIVSYGLQGRIREEVNAAVLQLVGEFLEANRGKGGKA